VTPALVKQLGSTGDKAASTTTLSHTFTGAVAAGNTIVCRVLFDNAAVASKPIVSSIARMAGETATWVLLGAARSTSTTAGSFASGEMWAIQTTVNWSAAAYAITFDTAITQKACSFAEWSGLSTTPRSTAGTAYSTTTTAASATTTGTTPVIGDVALGFIFGSNVATAMAGDNDTTGGSWSTPVSLGTTGGNVATNNFGIMQYKVLTAASHQTLNNSAVMTAGNGAIVAILQALPDPTITQASYQWYDDGTEAGAVALAAQDTAAAGDVTINDGIGQLRVRLQNTSSVFVLTTDDWQLQWEKNVSGTWTNVTAASTNARGYSSPNLTEGAATTNRLGAGTGTFVAGKVSEDGVADDVGISANNYTELLFSLALQKADLVNGDSLRFRVLRNGSTSGITYTAVPTITVRRVNQGTSAVAWSSSSVAVGLRNPKATITVPHTWVTAAVGKKALRGTAAVSHAWATAAVGIAAPAPPEGPPTPIVQTDFTGTDGAALTTLVNKGSLGGPAFVYQSIPPTAAPAWTEEITGNRGLVRTDPTNEFWSTDIFTAGSMPVATTIYFSMVITNAAAGGYIVLHPRIGGDGSAVQLEFWIHSNFLAVGNSGNVGHGLTFADGDTVHVLFRSTGPSHSATLWRNNNLQPSTPTATGTGGAGVGGQILLQTKRGPGQNSFYLDNFVVFDSPTVAWPPPPVLDLSDNFNRADTAPTQQLVGQLGPMWEPYSPHTWSFGGIKNNMLTAEYGSAHQVAYIRNDLAINDMCYAQIDFLTGGGEIYGPVLCHDHIPGTRGGYDILVQPWNNSCQFERNGAVVATYPTSVVTTPIGAWVTLRLEKRGAVITTLVNGLEVGSYTDPSPLTGNGLGFSFGTANEQRMDNWSGGRLPVFTDDFAGTGPLNAVSWNTGGFSIPARVNGSFTVNGGDFGLACLSGFPLSSNAQYAEVTKKSAHNVSLTLSSDTSVWTYPRPTGYTVLSRSDGVAECFVFGGSLGYSFIPAAPIGCRVRAEHDGAGNIKLLHDGVVMKEWDDPGTTLTGPYVWLNVSDGGLLDDFEAGPLGGVAPPTPNSGSAAVSWSSTVAAVGENYQAAGPNTGTAVVGWSSTTTAVGKRITQATAAVTWIDTVSVVGKRFTKSNAAVTWTDTLTAAGKRAPKATAATSWVETLLAAGKRTAQGAAAATWSVVTAATGKRSPKGTITAAHTWVTAAQGVMPIVGAKQGTAAVSWISALTSVGKRSPKATTTTTWSSVIAAAGSKPSRGTAAVSWVTTLLSAGKRAPKGAAAATTVDTLTATGKRSPAAVAAVATNWALAANGVAPTVGVKQGFATVTYSSAVTAVGKRVAKAGTATTYSFVTAAAGKKIQQAIAAVTWISAITAAVGKRFPKATVAVVYSSTVAAVGKRAPKATTAVTYAWATTANGVKPVIGFKQGFATVTYASTVTAAGKRSPKATAVITHAWPVAATGQKLQKGTTSTSYQWAATAAGKKLSQALVAVAYTVTTQAAGTRTPKARADVSYRSTVVAMGVSGIAGVVEGWWNGQEIVAMQYGSKPVIDWALVPA